MDASPSDQLLNDPRATHVLTIVIGDSPTRIRHFASLIEASSGPRFKLTQWKGTGRGAYREAFARGLRIAASQEAGKPGFFILSAVNNEIEIISLIPTMLKWLRLGSRWCEHYDNGRHVGISVGPFVINDKMVHHRLHYGRAVIILWMAYCVARLFDNVCCGRLANATWDLVLDNLALDHRSDPWGKNTLCGIVNTRRNGIKLINSENGKTIFDNLADNISGLILARYDASDAEVEASPALYDPPLHVLEVYRLEMNPDANKLLQRVRFHSDST